MGTLQKAMQTRQKTTSLNRYGLPLFLLAMVFVWGCKGPSKELQTEAEAGFLANPTDHVNPLIGTAPLTDPAQIGYTPPEGWRVWAGLTFPGSALPNAMVQASPITQYGSGAGYEYEDDTIIGFAHTNKGHWNLCNLPVLPVSAKATYPFASSFNHDQEKASPAYYEAYLKDYKVKVRLTSTLRAAFHEYTYEPGSERKILFDLGRANNGVSDWHLESVDSTTVQGYQRVGRDKIYFFAILNTPIFKTELKDEAKAGGYALLGLANGEGPVTMKMGLSYVSTSNAAENLAKEIGDKDFGTVHKEGVTVWDGLLSQIQIKGGTPKQQEMFYTCLYRTFLWPALRSDLNGQYTDVTGATRTEPYNYYTIPSLWDTYRNKLVLLGMLRPKVTSDVIKSLMDIGELTGYVPSFFHGDHAASFIAGSYNRGIRDFDVNKAYELLLNNAYKPSENGHGGRAYLKEYMELGYIPDPKVAQPHVETKAAAGVSKTLEYAYDDYSLAQLAKVVGDTVHYADLQKRAQNYKNVFDTKTHFMRGRWPNGEWITPFDPQYPYYEYMYREANAWQVSFYVPHDMPGLVELYGKDKFEQKLDSLFSFPWNPQHIARNISGFMGQYCQGNQPDHEAPFAYYYVGKPGKSQRVLDKLINNYYGIGDSGLALSGMDDAGEMSAWYVFAASGLYPVSPTDPKFLISLPVFDVVKWRLPSGKPLYMEHEGEGRNLTEIQVDQKAYDGYFMDYDMFLSGGNIQLNTDKN